MGRPRKMKPTELGARTMWCKCGEPIEVCDDRITAVTCVYCATNMRPIPNGYVGDVHDILKDMEEERLAKRNRKRGRPVGSKNKVTKVEDIEVKTKCPKKAPKSKTSKVGQGRGRGRVATVGAKVLEFIDSHKGNVKIKDILNIYSTERERLGKKASPDVEKRNCLSTLYVMKKAGKIKEVVSKSVYSSVSRKA